jgi:ABC-2 type transport system permease protein
VTKILKVAQREYIETVKTKVFLISVLMAPLIMAGIAVYAGKMAQKPGGPRQPLKIAIDDRTGLISEQVTAAFEKYNKDNPDRQILPELIASNDDEGLEQRDEQAKKEVRAGKLNGYIVVDKDALEGKGKVNLYVFKPKTADMDSFDRIERIVNRAIVDERCKLRNISRELLSWLRDVPFRQVELGEEGAGEKVQSEKDMISRMLVPFFFMYLMFMGIFGMGQHMLSSLIEEKSSRIIEMLLSAVSPFELMAGKVLGLGAIGLTVVGIWAGLAYGGASSYGITVDISTVTLAYFAAYYVLGFLIFSAMLAAIGSVCNTLKETQSLMMPLTLIFVVPMVTWTEIVRNPDGMMSRVMSFIPPLTPMVMVLRLSSGSGVWWVETAASFALLAATVPVAIWAAAKIFRTGILMYGKRPGLREVVVWLRGR